MSRQRLRAIRKGLRTLHTLEVMAVQIYRFQATGGSLDLRPHLIAAMQNEMRHVEDFLVKLLEYGFRPAWNRWMYWLVGWFFGYGSRILGREHILKTGIWVEDKAVHHYGELLETVEWDEDTRPIVEKDREDERHHIRLWQSLQNG
ncbi:MAG TPA: hypothetical protein ENN17_05560 [bacterium]|nr:hypothetical protein [bacterium]